MKKIFVFAILMLTAFVCVIGAEGWKGGGYTGPSSINVSKASEVKNMPHDTDVVMEGKIESYLGNEKYLFNDGSDTITLEIDHDVWNGLEVGPNDIVIIYGEVDKKFQRSEVEVERIEKKNS
ncbi:MAG: NirD/YgiW/YdeI family stress tolerance protein [Treponema sp.]|nr:NirD/YgiW/YdeI family stress tolerance protein [Treponema sp.]